MTVNIFGGGAPKSRVSVVSPWQHIRNVAALWAVRQGLALLFVYLVLGWWFARETREVGLFDPGGHPNYAILLLGAVYLLMRVAVRFLLPALLAYVVVDRAARALHALHAANETKVGRG